MIDGWTDLKRRGHLLIAHNSNIQIAGSLEYSHVVGKEVASASLLLEQGLESKGKLGHPTSNVRV